MSPLPVEKRLKKQGLQKKKSLFLLYSRTKFNVIEDEAYDIRYQYDVVSDLMQNAVAMC